MTFHKAKEEYKWKQWKEQEERILRKSGVSEEVIQRLRELDWQDFNAERRFWEHFSSNQEELYTRELEQPSSVVLNIQQLLDSVENEQLLQVLLESDKKTLQILLLKMWGFSVHEIAGQMGLPEKTDYSGSPAHPGRSSAQPDRASAHLIRSAVQLMPVADQHTC